MNKNRNRHIGRVNAYKEKVLREGKEIRTADGRIYRAAYLGSGGPSIVRDFLSEFRSANCLISQK